MSTDMTENESERKSWELTVCRPCLKCKDSKLEKDHGYELRHELGIRLLSLRFKNEVRRWMPNELHNMRFAQEPTKKLFLKLQTSDI